MMNTDENILIFLKKAEIIDKIPVKTNSFSLTKWTLSTNPSVSIKNSKIQSKQEIFLLKLLNFIEEIREQVDIFF